MAVFKVSIKITVNMPHEHEDSLEEIHVIIESIGLLLIDITAEPKTS